MNGTSPKYQRTHEELKKQALDLFLNKGYEASSIQEITKKTGLSVGAFYRHFASKEAIFAEIWDDYAGTNIEHTLNEVEKTTSLLSAMDYLLAENENFSKNEVTNKLYAIYASLAVSKKLNSFPHINQSSKKYRQMLYQLIKKYCTDFTEEEAMTTANAMHCLMNTYSMRNADAFQAFHFEKDAFRKCILTLLHL